jgi:hypothetical protein
MVAKILIAGSLLVWSFCAGASPSGERLAFVVGCINCHHQAPLDEMHAPSLLIVKTYSLPEFRRLLKTGVTRTGRNMLEDGNLMGIVATEQFSHLTDSEVKAVYNFLKKGWSQDRAAKEESKIPLLYKPKPANQ